MNALRRTLLVVYSLLVIAGAGGLIGLAWNQDRKLDISIGELNFRRSSGDDSAKYAFTALCAGCVVWALHAVAAVLRPARAAVLAYCDCARPTADSSKSPRALSRTCCARNWTPTGSTAYGLGAAQQGRGGDSPGRCHQPSVSIASVTTSRPGCLSA
jgi:hypothetical protein